MSIFSAMSTGVSGLAGQSKKFQTISDNVSNIGTTGYKATKMDFSSLVVESAMATAYAPGSLLARPRREIDAQGTIQVTNRATDAAISGNGFFAVRSDPASPSIEFTRAGSFDVDPMGFLRNGAGKYLMGFPVAADGTISGGTEGDLRPVSISGVTAAASPTRDIGVTANLPADPTAAREAAVFNGLTGPMVADPADPTHTLLRIADRQPRIGERWAFALTTPGVGGAADTTSTFEVVARAGETIDDVMERLEVASGGALDWTPNDDPSRAGTLEASASIDDVDLFTHGGFRTPATVYDSLGNAHRLDVVWTKTGEAGGWSVDIDGPTLSGAPSGTLGAGFPLAIGFDGTGQPSSGSGELTIDITWDASVTTASPSQVTLDLAGMTQLGETFEIAQVRGDGAGLGRLASVALDNSGFLNMTFTNGVQRPAFMVPIATFAAPNQLSPISGNSYRATVSSGAFTLSRANTGSAGSIVAGATEASTVDIAAEMTDMIVTQNAYAANVKTITTADEMLRELSRLKS
ncbi:MAG: flagellar hook protein FlgE [Alphaproteobacteria bacterium]